jgi:hypothetical protein
VARLAAERATPTPPPIRLRRMRAG